MKNPGWWNGFWSRLKLTQVREAKARQIRALESLESRTMLTADLAAQLINLDDFRAAYPGIDGTGYAIALVELGDFFTSHPVFGDDANSDGEAFHSHLDASDTD